MNIFIDTAVKGCNVVLFDGDRILAMQQNPIERGHAEAILPIYQDLLKKSGRESADIQAVYVSIGPGSFTGLRVGLTVARFIGFSLNVPVHGVTTFQCFSAGCEAEKNRAVLIETKRNDFYVQILDEDHKALSDAESLSVEQVIELLKSDMILTGDAVERFVHETGQNKYDLAPQDMLNLKNVVTAIQGEKLTIMDANPFYIRDADVSQPKKKVS